MRLRFDAPHFMTFHAYGFEGLTPDQRDAMVRRGYSLRVNHPLTVDRARVFLIGHGYAPVFQVTDGTGRVVFNGPVPFIAAEQAGLTSEGVIKVPDARPRQLGFAGVFLPTAVDAGGTASPAGTSPFSCGRSTSM